MITPGPRKARLRGVMPPISDDAVNMVCAPSKLKPPTRWLFSPNTVRVSVAWIEAP
jgi:hypothetical protein